MMEGVPSNWLVWVQVDEVEACAGRIKANGGKTLSDAIDLPGIGRMYVAMDSTGAASEMNGDVGAALAGHEGPIVGRNLELVPGSPFVQAWRVTAWPDGIYSVVRYVLEPTAAGTKVTLHHTGLPDGVDGPIADGWQSRYWTPMREFFAADA
jgi:activator of HSP90 ATPase